MAPLTSSIFTSLILATLLTFSYGVEHNGWKDKLNRHVASKNPQFNNNRLLQSTSGLRSGSSYEDPDMQLLQREARNGYKFTEKIDEQFTETIRTFASADRDTIVKLFQNVELLQGAETYQRMIISEGKTLETLTESELRQLAVGAIADTRDASTELQAYTEMTPEEQDNFVRTFKEENSELAARVTEGDLDATEEYNKQFQERITKKIDSSVIASDEKLRRRQQAFSDDSQLRMAIGDEEALEILDSPNLSFRMNMD